VIVFRRILAVCCFVASLISALLVFDMFLAAVFMASLTWANALWIAAIFMAAPGGFCLAGALLWSDWWRKSKRRDPNVSN